MPFELRNKIWKLVLGDQLIHLQYIEKEQWLDGERRVEKKRRCKHVVCQCDHPEMEPSQVEIEWRQPHRQCESELWGKWGFSYDFGFERMRGGPESMDLRALQVCQQIYSEANSVLWTTNTFSFDQSTSTFVAFMESRTTRQKQLLRKLRLQMVWHWEDDDAWNRIFGMPLIRSLIGLRSLHLQINHSRKNARDRSMEDRGRALGLFRMRAQEFVDKVAAVPLSNVKVFISEHYPSDNSESRFQDLQRRVENRLKYVGRLRRELLNSMEAEMDAREQKQLQEWCRKGKEKRKK